MKAQVPAAGALAAVALVSVLAFGWGTTVRASGPDQSEEAQAPTAEPAGRGANLYLRDCAWCHGNSLEGTARAPSLVGVGEASTRFYLATGRMPIAAPDELIRRGPPAYPPEEIRAIVDHVVAVGGGPRSPTVDPDAGDVAQGGELYRLHCGPCHGATGAGFPLLGGRNSPTVWEATPREVAEAIRIGPGGMPVFAPDTLTDEEVDSIVRYVTYLQDPDDRGGYHLFRIGPLTEGVVAWLAGVGLLLLAARRLGGRQ